jgi:tRNA A-37 threonylcarbamoyl transferase component Bud32
MADYLSKCLRDCTLFRVEKRWDRFVSMPRAEADFLAPIIAAPDTWMEAGRPLKQGRTATLALVEHEGRPLVIKRYNIKSVGHALSRSWRPSRAWHSWVEAHRLGFLGLATPRPLALIERRLGPLRGKAWLVTEHCSGGNLLEHLAPEIPPPAAELAALGTLFHQLTAARITHGDLKATNLLWDGEGISLIDLDAMRQHGSDRTFARAWRKDRERFLANWPAGSALRAVLESSLPPSA